MDWSAQIARAFHDYAAIVEAEQRDFEHTMTAADAMFAQATALGSKAYNDIARPAADAYNRALAAAEAAQDAILTPARDTYAAILARAQDVHDGNLAAAKSAYQRALSYAQDAYTALTSEPARPA